MQRIEGVMLGNLQEQVASRKGYVIKPDAVIEAVGDEWVSLTDNFNHDGEPIGRVKLRLLDGRVVANGELFDVLPENRHVLALGIVGKLSREENGEVEVYRVTDAAVATENKDPSIPPFVVQDTDPS